MNKEEMIAYVKSIGGIETPKGWNVPEHVNLSNLNLTEIPIQFNIVKGFFDCTSNNLTSLEGCPKIVEGGFYCYSSHLTSLKGCPKEVKDTFSCYNNKLTSLKYSPKIARGNFFCHNNQITSYKYAPKVISYFRSDKGDFKGKAYYDFLLKEKVITETEYLLYII